MNPETEEYKNFTKDINSLIYLTEKEWRNIGEYKRIRKDMKKILLKMKLTMNSSIPVFGTSEYVIPKTEEEKYNREFENSIKSYLKN